MFEQLKEQVGLPDILRVDNGPEFTSEEFTTWCESQGVFIDYIEPGEPNQNAFIERFNKSFRDEVLDVWLFHNLTQVREQAWQWMMEYNEERDHDGLGGRTPVEVYNRTEVSKKELST